MVTSKKFDRAFGAFVLKYSLFVDSEKFLGIL